MRFGPTALGGLPGALRRKGSLPAAIGVEMSELTPSGDHLRMGQRQLFTQL
jgi:hypothetical protein